MNRAVVWLAAAAVAVAAPVSAQPSTTFDPAALVVGEQIVVTTDRLERGRLVSADARAVVLEARGARHRLPVAEIQRIRHRSNGWRLGALLGGGAGLAGAAALWSLAGNESGSAGGAGLLLIAAGAGAGLAIDGLLGSCSTIFERPGASIDPLSLGAMFFVTAGPGKAYLPAGSGSASQVTSGVLFRIRGTRLSVGAEVAMPRSSVDGPRSVAVCEWLPDSAWAFRSASSICSGKTDIARRCNSVSSYGDAGRATRFPSVSASAAGEPLEACPPEAPSCRGSWRHSGDGVKCPRRFGRSV